MNTFFKQLSELISDNQSANISVTKNGNGLVVSILVKQGDVTDPSAKKIQPLICKGTAEELDSQLFQFISQPIQSASALLVNMKSYEDSVATAEATRKEQKDKEKEQEKEITKNDKKFNKLKEEFLKFYNEKNIERCEAYISQLEKLNPVSGKCQVDLSDLRKKFDEIKPQQTSLLDAIDETENISVVTIPSQPAQPEQPQQPNIETNESKTHWTEDRQEAFEADYYRAYNQQSDGYAQDIANKQEQADLQYNPNPNT
jgi:PRTRC genetic system protein E